MASAIRQGLPACLALGILVADALPHDKQQMIEINIAYGLGSRIVGTPSNILGVRLLTVQVSYLTDHSSVLVGI